MQKVAVSKRQLQIFCRGEGAQNFDSAHKFFKNEGFSAPTFVFLDENFPTDYNLGGGEAIDGIS